MAPPWFMDSPSLASPGGNFFFPLKNRTRIGSSCGLVRAKIIKLYLDLRCANIYSNIGNKVSSGRGGFLKAAIETGNPRWGGVRGGDGFMMSRTKMPFSRSCEGAARRRPTAGTESRWCPQVTELWEIIGSKASEQRRGEEPSRTQPCAYLLKWCLA